VSKASPATVRTQIARTREQILKNREELRRIARLPRESEVDLPNTPPGLLAGRAVLIRETAASHDRILVEAAEPGSIYLLKNGQIHVKMPTGWVDVHEVIDRLDELLPEMTPEARSILYQVADGEMLRWTQAVDLLAKHQ
jgi:hypothetical protein